MKRMPELVTAFPAPPDLYVVYQSDTPGKYHRSPMVILGVFRHWNPDGSDSFLSVSGVDILGEGATGWEPVTEVSNFTAIVPEAWLDQYPEAPSDIGD